MSGLFKYFEPFYKIVRVTTPGPFPGHPDIRKPITGEKIMGMFKQSDSDDTITAQRQGVLRTIGEFACHRDATVDDSDMIWRPSDGVFIILRGKPLIMPRNSITPIKVWKRAEIAEGDDRPTGLEPGKDVEVL